MISDAELIDWMKADTADVATLRKLEQAAIAAISEFTGRYLGVTAAVTDIIRFKGWPLALANDPIGGTLTSLEQWNGTVYAAEVLTNYLVDGSFVWPNTTFTWPVYSSQVWPQRFRAIYQAGYAINGSDANVWAAPADIQQAVKLLVGNWFEHRESVVVGEGAYEVPQSVQMLLSPHTRVAV